MKNTTRKLCALNLALLLACSLLPLPALALETDTLLPEEILLLIGNETEDYFLLKKESRRKGSSH